MGVLLLGKQEEDRSKAKKTWDEMTDLERLQEENEGLRAENAVLKKLREYRLRDEERLREQHKSSKN